MASLLGALKSEKCYCKPQNGSTNECYKISNNMLNNSRHKKSCKFSLKKSPSYGDVVSVEFPESKVLVIFTGGTIGMMRNERNVLEPIPDSLVKKIRKYPNIHDEEYATRRFGSKDFNSLLVLPQIEGEKRRIIYTIKEYNPILDSSNMTIADWVSIGVNIQEAYEFFDGFVVLHGTDTLSYTASALSFMLENLGKTVIITGSQIPIFETRTDGKDNFTSALIIAGSYLIPEVCILFGKKLMRGNRTVKISCESFEAFDSPNVTPIATLGINIIIDYRSIFRPNSISKCAVTSKLDENVGILRLFPSISVAAIKAFLQPPMRGVVLQTFGSGNVPSNRYDLLKEFQLATMRGMILINCTQCTTGSVREIYQTGEVLYEAGVISGYDMTPEAALTKLSYVLGKEEWSLDYKKQMMQTNLRGELTCIKTKEIDEYDLLDAVAKSLNISSQKEQEKIGEILIPAMIGSAVLSGDLSKINKLKSKGTDLSVVNCDQRTALHIACSEGNLEMVENLLLNGVSVHSRDRHGNTPLIEAINIDNHKIITVLIKCGAHLTGSTRALGVSLCSAAARDFVKRLESYRLARADLSQPDYSGRTALHVASLHGNEETVQYLIEKGVDQDCIDLLGFTPAEYANKSSNYNLIKIFKNI